MRVRVDGDHGVQVYGNVSRSYEPPSFSESIASTLTNKAQTATTFELGTRGAYRAVRWDASVYHANIEDELLAIDHDNNPGTPAITVNADKTTHSGVELGFEGDLLGCSWEEKPDNRLVFRKETVFTNGRRERSVELKPLRQPSTIDVLAASKSAPASASAADTAKNSDKPATAEKP